MMVEEKQMKKSISFKLNHASVTEGNPANQSCPFTEITQFLLLSHSVHQHQLYPTWTPSVGDCQQAAVDNYNRFLV